MLRPPRQGGRRARARARVPGGAPAGPGKRTSGSASTGDERVMAIKLPIFMDNHATTPVDPRVLEEMLPYFTTKFGNAASRSHPFGWEAEEAVDHGRERIARLIGAKDSRVDPADVKKAITEKTILVSVMLANNEIGTVQPLEEIGKITRERAVLFHSDAVQGIGKVEFDVQKMNLDLVSITAHKMYGPKGVGALYVRRSKPRVRLVAQMDGGGHERGMRSGTLAVPLIVGFGKACDIMLREGKAESVKLAALRERLRSRIMGQLDEVYINGSIEHRLPGNLNISFNFVEGEGLMMAIKDVAVSSGSACTSARLEPSYVLRALGVGDELAHSSIRFGLGRFNTEEEVDYVADLVVGKVKGLRDLSPLWEMHKEGIDLKSIEWAAH